MINADLLQLYIDAAGGYSLAVSTTTIEFSARTLNRKGKMSRLSTRNTFLDKYVYEQYFIDDVYPLLSSVYSADRKLELGFYRIELNTRIKYS